ncbi:hypothetical protein FNV43_RR15971 [Rhamnella rubrinervis]|uniref:SCP domain-containing protein n=1 Tax=Rhamnella rubrinervis TaxID=2594499 RepID=A0A8K0E2Q3_9ROSA|nr:hypothetical protein FNV43_RR15971 [Rhamnella rubrinervis]
MSSSIRVISSIIILISVFVLAVSAKGHHRGAPGAGQAQVVHQPTVGAPPAIHHHAPSPPRSPAVNQPPVAAAGKGHESREFLDAHNVVRKEHNQTLYTWDKKLARYARRWGLKLQNECVMNHSYGPFGENMFWGKYDHWTPTEAVQSWAMESKDYNRDTNACNPNTMCGHYTQIVWHESLRLGCARMKCNNGSVLLICEYDPPGNFINESPFGNLFNSTPTTTPSSSSPSNTMPPPTPPAAA